MLHWTNIGSIQVAEYHSNPAALICVVDVTDLVATASGADIEAARVSVRRAVEKNRTWAGCDVFLLPYHFGFDAVLFVKAVSGYVNDPGRRRELAPRPTLTA